MVPNTPFHVAAESSILAFNFAFNHLLLEEAIFWTKTQNLSLLNYFHKCLRSEDIERKDDEFWFRFHKRDFPSLLMRYKHFHNIKY